MLSLSLLPQEGAVADSFWVSLKYFNFYRIAVAAIFLLAALIFGDALSLGSHDCPQPAPSRRCSSLQ